MSACAAQIVDLNTDYASPAAVQAPPPIPAPKNIVSRVKTNLTFRSKWAELNGAMGDLGTYIPIVTALALANGLDLGVTLVFTGVYNFLTGALYGVPMPVQPMKSIAAVAISSGQAKFGVPEIMAAGILTSALVFALGVTGLMRVVYRLIPLPVVRGIQLGQGLSFALTAVRYVRNDQDLAKGKSLGQRSWTGPDGLALSIAATCFIVLVNGAGQDRMDSSDESAPDMGTNGGLASRSKTRTLLRKAWLVLTGFPSAVLVFVLGIALAAGRNTDFAKGFHFGPSSFHVVHISRHAWKEGFIRGTIPQIPLSILNSVIAVCRLSHDLFPEKPPATPTSVAVTMGLMNIVGCWFGAMPCCHGAGGLAGQYRFGGRTGGSVAVLGAGKLVVGLVVGRSLIRLLSQFPVGLLGVLLLFAGIELAAAARDMNEREEAFVVLVVAAVSLVGSSAALGFVVGMVAHLLLWARRAAATACGARSG